MIDSVKPSTSSSPPAPAPPLRAMVEPTQPDAERVLAALGRALEASDGKSPETPLSLVRRADLQGLGAEQLRPSLDRIITSRHADAGLDVLLTSGLLEALLPEMHALVGFGDGEWRHKDVWKHTKQVVVQSVPRLEVRWAAVFHDIGKVKTRSISETGEVHFFGHAEVGARMFDKLERRERLFDSSSALFAEVRFLVLHHLRASSYEGQWTDSAVRRFTREMGPYLDDLLCLSRADITTKRPEKKRRGIRLIHELGERIELLAAEDAKVPPLPKGVGELLMQEFGLPPSKLVGDIKRALEAACELDEIESGQSSEYYVDFVARHRERFGISG
ncbi:MAG TPA: HD domain-containing protein [Polyangiaceae bacterium]|nr:HD domain-containing protein [Polyangiaceae bacterium]